MSGPGRRAWLIIIGLALALALTGWSMATIWAECRESHSVAFCLRLVLR